MMTVLKDWDPEYTISATVEEAEDYEAPHAHSQAFPTIDKYYVMKNLDFIAEELLTRYVVDSPHHW